LRYHSVLFEFFLKHPPSPSQFSAPLLSISISAEKDVTKQTTKTKCFRLTISLFCNGLRLVPPVSIVSLLLQLLGKGTTGRQALGAGASQEIG
jgi:hypothetical protein